MTIAAAGVEVLQAMAGQAEQRSRVEQQGFKGRLQVLALTSPHQEIRRAAEEILGGVVMQFDD